MNILNKIIIILLPCLVLAKKTTLNVNYLEPGLIHEYTTNHRPGYFSGDLQIYCYSGTQKYLSHIFQTVQLDIDIKNDDFVQYEGATPDIVQTHYQNQRSIFSFSLFNTYKKKTIKMNPFNQTCVGIETAHPYRIHLNLIRIDFWKVVLLCLGLFIFWSASGLSETPLFYYISGIFLGIFASFLVVVYFLSKMFPRKPMMYGVMVGGWSLSIYFAQLVWENVQVIFVTYQTYLFWYTIITGFISFIICYRMGPPKNERSKNIIKWGLQLASMAMIFYSSQYQEAAVGMNILTVLLYYFPKNWILSVKRMWHTRYPPKRRLLTDAEYYEQTAKETAKALEDLKNFCSSPESKPWRTMTKLKDPQRFASFMEGAPHLLDNEIIEYESFSQINSSDISDDDSDEEHPNRNVTTSTPIVTSKARTPLRQRNGTPSASVNGRNILSNRRAVSRTPYISNAELSEDDD